MEKFRIRPGRGGVQPLIEFCGDHRAPGFPDVARILAATLGATRQTPSLAAEVMIASDRYVDAWSYEGGIYEIDDDVWACFIHVPDGRDGVVADIERALLHSGRFVRADGPAPG
jgi:hypothetical protein